MLVLICVQSICIIFLIWHKYSASLQHQCNWCQPPLPTTRRPSRANGVTPVPAPMAALPFRCLLTSVCPTPVPPTPHPVHPYHPDSNQPAHKIQCFLIQSSRYDTIKSRRSDTIQPTIWYDPADDTIWSCLSSDQKTHPRPILSCLTASTSIFYTTFPADAPSSDFSPSPASLHTGKIGRASCIME